MKKNGKDRPLRIHYQNRVLELYPECETEYGQPQMWLVLSDDSSLEITRELTPDGGGIYAMRHHCSDDALDKSIAEGLCGRDGVLASYLCSDFEVLTEAAQEYLNELAGRGIVLIEPSVHQEILEISCQHLSGDTKRFLDRVSHERIDAPCLKTKDGWTVVLRDCAGIPYLPKDLGLCLLLAAQKGYETIAFSKTAEPFLSLPIF